MKAKLIREIPQREGLPYYFRQYEFECIECGQHYTRNRYDNRTTPYCASCGAEHIKQRQKELDKERRAKRERDLINEVLGKIRVEIIKKQTYKLFEDTEKLVALDEVLQIIDKYMRGTE